MKKQKDFSEKITSWIGSKQSLYFHTLFFVIMFGLSIFNIPFSDILLILTTVVSLEAIYLAIFIQITINKQAEELKEISEDVEEISGDVEDISKDVEEIQKDVEDIQGDVEDISEDVEEIQKDVEEISEDVEEIGEDVEEINEEVDDTEVSRFEYIEHKLQLLLNEIENLKKESPKKINKKQTKTQKKTQDSTKKTKKQ